VANETAHIHAPTQFIVGNLTRTIIVHLHVNEEEAAGAGPAVGPLLLPDYPIPLFLQQRQNDSGAKPASSSVISISFSGFEGCPEQWPQRRLTLDARPLAHQDLRPPTNPTKASARWASEQAFSAAHILPPTQPPLLSPSPPFPADEH
jgi:hypothetical protein